MLEFLKTQHGIFTNNEELNKTAQEVYDEWLSTYFDYINGEWVPKQIDICPSPTLDDLVADANETRSRLDTVENAILDLLLKA